MWNLAKTKMQIILGGKKNRLGCLKQFMKTFHRSFQPLSIWTLMKTIKPHWCTFFIYWDTLECVMHWSALHLIIQWTSKVRSSSLLGRDGIWKCSLPSFGRRRFKHTSCPHGFKVLHGIIVLIELCISFFLGSATPNWKVTHRKLELANLYKQYLFICY